MTVASIPMAADVRTPDDVAAPDHDGELYAPGHHPLDLLSDPPEGLHVDAVRLTADQRLTRELEDDAREHRSAAVRSHRPGHVHVGDVGGHVLAAPFPSGEDSPTR